VKRTITIILLVIIHAYSSYSLSIGNKSTFSERNISCENNQQTTSHKSQPTSFFLSNSHFILGAEINVVNFGFNLLKLPQRINFGSEHIYRIRNFKQLVIKKIDFINQLENLFKASNQLDGYYLYHLRKLLI